MYDNLLYYKPIVVYETNIFLSKLWTHVYVEMKLSVTNLHVYQPW